MSIQQIVAPKTGQKLYDIYGNSLKEQSNGFTTTLRTPTLTANRLINLPDLDGTLSTSTGSNPFNQDLNTTDNVQFATTNAALQSTEQLVIKKFAVAFDTVIIQSFGGNTQNRVLYIPDKTGTIATSDQDIDSTSNVLFNSVETPTLKLSSGLYDSTLSLIGPLAGNTALTLPITSGQIALTSDIVANNKQQSTGLLSGGSVTVNADDTKFDVASGTGCFVDINGLITNVSWPTFTAQTVALSGIVTYIGISSSLLVISQSTPWTPSQHRTIIQLGILVHTNGINITTTNQEQQTVLQTNNQLHDFMDFIGKFNIQGNQSSPSLTLPASLKFSVSSGFLCVYGSNFINDPLNPHKTATSTTDTNAGGTFQYRMRNGTSSLATLTNIIPNILDNGTNYPATTYANNQYGISRIFRFTSGSVRIQPPQFSYTSMDLAFAGLVSESFIVEPSIADNGILIGYLCTRGATTALNNTSDAQFRSIVKFGAGALSSAINPFDQSLNTTDTPTFNALSLYNHTTLTSERALDIGASRALDNYLSVGWNAGISLTGVLAYENCVVGPYALYSATTGIRNCIMGNGSLWLCTNSNDNTCIGNLAGGQILGTCSDNTFIGSRSGYSYTSTESNNICINSIGVIGESNKTRIGTLQTDCYISGNLHQTGEINGINKITSKEPTNNNLRTTLTFEVGTQRGILFAEETGIMFKNMQIGFTGSNSSCFFAGDVDLNSGSSVYRIAGTNKLSATHLNTVNQFPSVAGKLAVSGIGTGFMSFYNSSLNSTLTTMGASPTSLKMSIIADGAAGASNWTVINDGVDIVWFRCDNTLPNYYAMNFNCAVSLVGGGQTAYMYIEVNGVKKGQIYINLTTTLINVNVSAIAQISNGQLVKVFVGNLTNATQVFIYGANFNASQVAEFNQ